MTRLSRVTRTTAFKLSLLYIAVFTLLSGFLLVYISQNTDNLMSEQVVQTIDAELNGLSDIYVRGGVRDLVQTIDRRSRHPDASLYLLVDFAGNALAGNIARLPTLVLEEADGGLRRVHYTRQGQDISDVERQAMVRTFELRGGFRLLVGRDLGEQLRFSNLLANALRLWLIVVVVMAAITWIFVSRRVMKRIDEITDTSRTIMTGDLTERLPVAGNDDEFDRLAVSLNTMLDRIELLMRSMKDVTDNIAHDLKTPLTRLQIRVESALRDAESGEGYRTALEDTLSETDQLLRVFNALLRIARIEAMAPGDGLERVDVKSLVSEIAELYEPLIEDEGGVLEINVTDGVFASCQKELVVQGLVNLIENALKYGRPSEGDLKIRLSAKEKDARIVLSVEDNGSGIPDEQQERVQDRFVRLDESRSEPGTGLGLSLVKAVARLHGGNLRFTNGNPGLIARIDLSPAEPGSGGNSNGQDGHGSGRDTSTDG
ncbi:HAMP domain-containing sensor histidine kinase [Labrenzia sp. PHM005]|uniref:sensor histidine kinase n=1 Tax=Labrenzia sp. PHM005 TaxID=2590016 RepID=UPI00113FD959|nr:HAMP domain-containing sensor histidine kinase [Labrenzia sp. PHM005]QDG78389.1 HAMP domain-containing histidine kinase [Labrenzia sp. PHM005]